MQNIFRSQLINSFNWLFPNRCQSCHHVLPNHRAAYCEPCYLLLPFQSNCCNQCGQAFTGLNDHCGRCLTSPPNFDACFCPFRYEQPLRNQIIRFKYGERPELALGLARTLAHEIEANQLVTPELLIPVPLHISRLRQRGFNQSLLLVKELSKLLKIPYSNSIVEKHRPTKPQAEQSLRQRKSNLRNCFRIIDKGLPKHVAIVDDVFTTGTTASEITKILKRNGVDYVQVWGLAHTI